MQEQINQLKCLVYDKSMQAGQHQQAINQLQEEINKANQQIAELQNKMKEATPKEN